jgi:hypothetical protein
MSESRSFHYLNEVALAYDDEVGCDWWIDRGLLQQRQGHGYEIYNGSMVELDYLLKTVDTEEISKNMKEHNEFRKKKISGEWKKVMNKFIV